MFIAWCVTGSFCTIGRACDAMESITKGGRHEVVPVLSPIVRSIDTRFGRAADIKARIEGIAAHSCLGEIVEAEPFGPFTPPDIVVVSPCTGNTLAKLAAGITDTAVTMTVKAQLRRDAPVLLAVCSNDALSSNLAALAAMINRGGVFVVPMTQDDPINKPHSAVADFTSFNQAFNAAVEGRQLYPIFKT